MRVCAVRLARAFATALGALAGVWLSLRALSFASPAAPAADPRSWDRDWAAALAVLDERPSRLAAAHAALVEDDWLAGELALPVVARAHGDGLATLRAALRARLPAARERACIGLGLLGSEAGPAVADLLGALRDPAAVVRASAAWALGRTADASEPVVAALVERLDVDEEWVRREAVAALARVSPAPPPAIVRRLTGVDSARCAWALLVVTNMGPRAAPAVPALVTLAREYRNADLFRRTTAALRAIGPAAAPAAGPLLARLRTGDAADAGHAGAALAAIGAPSVPGLLDVAAAGDRRTTAALQVLDDMGDGATEALGVALAEAAPPVRRLAAALLAQRASSSAGARQALSRARTDPDVEVAAIACRAAVATGDRPAESCREVDAPSAPVRAAP
ncbi:MAG: HEAT repeat domain-containing protein [bacterium]